MVCLILLTIVRNDNVNTETVIQISHKFHEYNTLVSFLDLINTRRLRTFRVFVCTAKICILKGKTVSKLENLKKKKKISTGISVPNKWGETFEGLFIDSVLTFVEYSY